MPYKDPEKQKAAQRASMQRGRQRKGAAQMGIAAVEADAEVDRVLPDPPDADEAWRLLGVQARLGSVRALELIIKRQEASDHGSDVDEFDELAARRAFGA